MAEGGPERHAAVMRHLFHVSLSHSGGAQRHHSTDEVIPVVARDNESVFEPQSAPGTHALSSERLRIQSNQSTLFAEAGGNTLLCSDGHLHSAPGGSSPTSCRWRALVEG